LSIAVVDASVIVDSLLVENCAVALMQLTETHSLAAPEHIFAEVLSSLRRIERNGAITSVFSENCITLMENSAIESYPLRPLLQDCWLLRFNITQYDAPYVVLAGELDCPLYTHDSRLAKAAQDHVRVHRLLPDTAP
jgi:predicted nucleic acid-binding protein